PKSYSKSYAPGAQGVSGGINPCPISGQHDFTETFSFSVSLSLSLSVSPPLCLSVCLSVCLSLSLSLSLCVCVCVCVTHAHATTFMLRSVFMGVNTLLLSCERIEHLSFKSPLYKLSDLAVGAISPAKNIWFLYLVCIGIKVLGPRYWDLGTGTK
ncbi:mCG144589, partial [Mus musculus]